jgi:hypothetical protein
LRPRLSDCRGRVPADARVEVHGIAIGGRRIEPASHDARGATIVVYAFAILGGVKVSRVSA